ncbi:hypothetical protein [Hyalangium versicolor]|uniref:hypothetical protein n=1 Tax=Hyalangium versicolor TaxID=2861190 RepID=UPI001CCACE61|nr:hypothetical protein [Hyalangium versicolor]
MSGINALAPGFSARAEVTGVADGLDALQAALDELGEDARCTLELRFDPAGARQAVEPIRLLRRDVPLELQVLDHLAALNLPTGDYSLRIREKGRHVSQATVSLRVRDANTAVTTAVTPAVTPSVTPPVAPAVAPPTDLFREVTERLIREAVESKLNPPREEYEEDPEEEGDGEGASPLATGLLGLLERAIQSPVLAPAVAELVESVADVLKVRARTSDAKARLYEARAARAGAAPRQEPAEEGTRGKVVGFRRKATVGAGGTEGGGTHGTES